jgi:hypothetical protein
MGCVATAFLLLRLSLKKTTREQSTQLRAELDTARQTCPKLNSKKASFFVLSTPAMRPAGRDWQLQFPVRSTGNKCRQSSGEVNAQPGTLRHNPAQLAALSSSLAGHILDPLSGEQFLRRR